jgi:outer membrane translocation and assembly module TamA
MAATIEYQWQIFSGVSLAIFADTGKVFRQWDRWSLAGLEKSYGGGVRFGAGRFDVGYGREGPQFWVVFATF